MSRDELERAVRREVEDVHAFFTRWFSGAGSEDELGAFFAPRLDRGLIFISPDANHLDRQGLLGMFDGAHGSNPPFRVEIRDVSLVHDLDDCIVATYTEWQWAAKSSSRSNNGRLTTVVLAKQQPFKWMHIHETWLPEDVQAAGLRQ